VSGYAKVALIISTKTCTAVKVNKIHTEGWTSAIILEEAGRPKRRVRGQIGKSSNPAQGNAPHHITTLNLAHFFRVTFWRVGQQISAARIKWNRWNPKITPPKFPLRIPLHAGIEAHFGGAGGLAHKIQSPPRDHYFFIGMKSWYFLK
jgi:hypothetical protein